MDIINSRKRKTAVSKKEKSTRRKGRDGDLYFFQTLAECGRLSSAAARLDRSVSSVSKQLNRLEERLAIQLVRRDAHSFRLTEAGQRYLEEAIALNSRMNDLESELRAMSHTVSGPLRVATSDGIFDSHLKSLLPEFMQQHPDIHLSISTIGHGARLGDDEFDCQILRVDIDDIPTHMETVELFRSSSVVCASPKYLEHRGCPDEPQDLKQFDCLATLNKSGKRVNHWRFKQGGKRLSVLIEPRFSGLGWQVRAMAALGMGIARLPEHMAFGPGSTEGSDLVKVLPHWRDPDRRAVTLMHSGSGRPTPQLQQFVEFVSRGLAGTGS